MFRGKPRNPNSKVSFIQYWNYSDCTVLVFLSESVHMSGTFVIRNKNLSTEYQFDNLIFEYSFLNYG